MTDPSPEPSLDFLAKGGGDRTASGVHFQAALGAMVGVWMLTDGVIDPHFGLGAAKPSTMRFETEAPVDDILVETSEGGFLAFQAKTSLSVSPKLESEFGKTVEQIVRHFLSAQRGQGLYGWDRTLSVEKDRLVIAAGTKSPATLKYDLASALDRRRGPQPTILSAAQEAALSNFDSCLEQAWAKIATEPLDESTKLKLSQLTTVFIFEPEGSPWAALSATLSPAMASPSDGPAALNLLVNISMALMQARSGADVGILRRRLLDAGVKLTPRVDIRLSVERLRAYSKTIRNELAAYEVIKGEDGKPVSVERECLKPILAAAPDGPLLITGEPGAGKSGVINAVARALADQGHDVVSLAVDRFSVETLEGLTSELGLNMPVLEVLAGWDGADPAYLVIDALDATRGGKGEAAFRLLVERVQRRADRWRVIASIRSFDLRMGVQFRELFKGSPPDRALAEPGLERVRHIRVPAWSSSELDQLLATSPTLRQAVSAGSEKLRDLASVPFNTRLLADLINDDPDIEIGAIGSQIELLNLYWDHRIQRHGAPAEACLRRIVKLMVDGQALHVSRLSIAETDGAALDKLIAEGVIVSSDQGVSIQFRHHLLFDYVASRVYLDPYSLRSGPTPFPKSATLGLMLAPALTFLLHEMWAGETDHARYWAAIGRLLPDEDTDPVARSVASRVSAELPSKPYDLARLAQMVHAGDEGAARCVFHIVGALSVRLEDGQDVELEPWFEFAQALAVSPEPVAWPLRTLCFLLADRLVGIQQVEKLGSAARSLLEFGMNTPTAQGVVAAAVGFVAQTYSSDPARSRHLLSALFSDENFDNYVAQEIPALARNISAVSAEDPDFAADIYAQIYARSVLADRETRLNDSQILGLKSNARQDFSMARYSLSEHFADFLRAHPRYGAAALVWAVEG